MGCAQWWGRSRLTCGKMNSQILCIFILLCSWPSSIQNSSESTPHIPAGDNEKDGGLGSQNYPPPKQFPVTRPDSPGPFAPSIFPYSPHEGKSGGYGKEAGNEMEGTETEDVPRSKLWSPLSRSARRSGSWSTRIISTTEPTARKRDELDTFRSASFPESAGREGGVVGRGENDGTGTRSLIGNMNKLSWPIHTSSHSEEREREDDGMGRKTGESEQEDDEDDDEDGANELQSWLRSHPSSRQESQEQGARGLPSSSPHQPSRGQDGVEEKGRDEEEAAGPIIASIRHHKSRKSFTRTRKGWKGGKSGESTQSVFTLLNEEQADEPHAGNTPPHLYSTSPTFSKKSPFTHHPFPTTQPQNRRPTSSKTESNEHYYGAPTAPDDHPHYMLQAEKDSSGPEEGRVGRKKGMGSKKGLVQPRGRENGESNGDERPGFISSLSATNDSQLVYGQPYFTPNRKRNSTRMQRIKNLLRNSTEESGKGRVEMIYFPTQDTQHTPGLDSLPSLSSFPLRGESGGRVTGKADGESDIVDGNREGGGGGFKVSKVGKGSKSREKLRKNNNSGRRKTTSQSSTFFSPTESAAHVSLPTNSPSTTLLPTNNHHNTQQEHQQNFDSTPSGTSQSVLLNGHLARVSPSKFPSANNYTMSGASHGANSPSPDSPPHQLSPTRPTRPRNKERNNTKEGRKVKVKAEIMTSRSELTGWDERGNQETSTAGNEQMSSVSSLTLEEAEVWSKEPLSKVPQQNNPSEFSDAKRTSGGGLVSSEMFPASVTESGGEEGNGERWSDGRETGGEDDLDNDYTSLAKLEGSTDENGSFLPSTQLSESEMEVEEDVGGGGGGEGEVQVTGSPPGGSRARPDMDIVTKFLRIVETQHTLGDNCTAGTAFNLGEGVVDRYAQERFRLEANVAVNRANMLTRLWKYAEMEVMNSEYLLHASLFSMIEFDDDIFAAGNCYDKREYKNYTLFCPFAYRLPEGNILVKDLAVEYKYLSNSSEWFYIARKNAQTVIKNHNQISTGFNTYTYNESTHTDRIDDEILNVTYDDGKWSKPYFDCGGGNIWVMTYTVPFFGFKDGHYYFKGTSGIDIDLRRVDIDQCPLPENSTELNIFAASDKCKNATTKCVPIKGLGFRRGSYRCECQSGFYFPNVSSPLKFFNGTVLEEEYEKKLSNDLTLYDQEGAFECLRCPTGCDSCEDDRPCVVTLNWLMRSAILILQCAIIAMLPIVGLFTWKYSDIKVVRAASPVLLRFIVLGAFFIYCTILVMYPSPSVITCTLRVWLREIGFSLAYGALMLKTWRISVIFRVRSAKAVKITDLDLMKRLGIIVAMFTALLVIRTLVAPPVSIVSLTADDLKAWLCKSDWWDHSFTIMELMFLVWGIRLCIVVRKAPSEFNESKFISLAIYNEFLLSVFLNISMLFLQSPANPDLLYIIFFCHVQLTMTLLLCLIFGSKAYMVFRGHGKGNSSDETRVPTFISKNRSGQKPKQPSGHNSTTGVHSSTTSTSHALEVNFPNNSSRLSEDVQLPELDVVEWVNSAVEEAEREPIPESESETTEEEFRRLYYQLEELKERNMRLGNRHLVAKITAMQEAADNILGGTSGDSGRGGGGGEGGLRREFLDKSASLSQAIDSISMTTLGGSVCVGGGGTGLSDITEEDSGCGKPPKTKRASFLSRVRSSKRLLSIRSSSGSGAESKTGRGERGDRSVTSGCSSSQGVESGATGSSPAPPPPSSPKPSSLQGERDSSSNKCVRKLSECDVDGASGGGGSGAGAKNAADPLRAPPDDEGMAHGGVYIGPSDPPTGPTLPPPTSSHSPFSRPKTEEKEGREEDEGGSERRGNECEGGSRSSGGSWEREEGVHKLKSTICIHNPLEGGEAEREGEGGPGTAEISSHGVGAEGKKGEEHVLVGSSGGGAQSKSEKGKRKGRGKGRGEGVSGSNGESNHTSAADGSKIMLDLNDKSRFTEEITV